MRPFVSFCISGTKLTFVESLLIALQEKSSLQGTSFLLDILSHLSAETEYTNAVQIPSQLGRLLTCGYGVKRSATRAYMPWFALSRSPVVNLYLLFIEYVLGQGMCM